MNAADIMREKQRRADLIKQGIDPDADKQETQKKEYDTSYLDKYNLDDGDEENKEDETKEEEITQAAAATQSSKQGKGKKNK